MTHSTAAAGHPIKVGIIADRTGPLSFVGLANANVARMVVGDINAKGGLLGRRVRPVPRGRRDKRRHSGGRGDDTGRTPSRERDHRRHHARIAEGPGGPAEMVPGQHHARLHMYIAQARAGRFEVVKSLGAIDPKEQLVEPAMPDRMSDGSTVFAGFV